MEEYCVKLFSGFSYRTFVNIKMQNRNKFVTREYFFILEIVPYQICHKKYKHYQIPKMLKMKYFCVVCIKWNQLFTIITSTIPSLPVTPRNSVITWRLLMFGGSCSSGLGQWLTRSHHLASFHCGQSRSSWVSEAAKSPRDRAHASSGEFTFPGLRCRAARTGGPPGLACPHFFF